MIICDDRTYSAIYARKATFLRTMNLRYIFTEVMEKVAYLKMLKNFRKNQTIKKWHYSNVKICLIMSDI